MDLAVVIAAARIRCAAFSNRIAGAAEYKILPEAMQLAVPCAYVVPLDDDPDGAMAMNSVRQKLTDSFAVIVAVSNTSDERGQAAAAQVETLRGQLWAGLLGWRPAERYDGIVYQGGHLLHLDRARLWYQFEFGAAMEIGPADGWQETELAGLPDFEGATIEVDVVDPIADPNVEYPGPDGRVEFTVHADPET